MNALAHTVQVTKAVASIFFVQGQINYVVGRRVHNADDVADAFDGSPGKTNKKERIWSLLLALATTSLRTGPDLLLLLLASQIYALRFKP